ncbi:uncharacterized protein BDZ83DRAFT_597197 [Colletotrichum acutatum]|uniref:Uncharacterized protein n=1 Tax=Glomerella acutata TaxID=27357 RepID=A0AAD9D310_GLOAC|nr:uncharacterized protein BDZ83DRAFT_597197 [Colletotrichum acutatum]KAK1731917.1 hypothetical protein BDZ83DRAFT_597197 [Colletotrichum acutatum]
MSTDIYFAREYHQSELLSNRHQQSNVATSQRDVLFESPRADLHTAYSYSAALLPPAQGPGRHPTPSPEPEQWTQPAHHGPPRLEP